MRFYTEEQRLAHPQACLIPGDIFQTKFNQTLSDLEIDLMSSSFEALAPRVEGLKAAVPALKEAYWLCIALSHPGASDDELMNLATELGLPPLKLFRYSAFIGRLNIMNRLTTVPADAENMIKANNFESIRWAAQGGHLPVFERILELASADMPSMIIEDEVAAFRWAAKCGHIAIMERIIALIPNIVQDNNKTSQYKAFRYAAAGGHIPVMERLIALAPTEKLEMIKAADYDAFHAAAEAGHLAVIEKLMELAPTEVQNMIKVNRYSAFRAAARGGHLAIMERLIGLTPPDDVAAMIEADSFGAFRQAAQEGHLDVMLRLLELAPAEALNMIRANDYVAFRTAASNGHLAVIEKLITLAPAEVSNMIKAHNYYAFLGAAGNGHLTTMERLMALASDDRENMIKATRFASFANAAAGGHLPVIERLIELAPTDVMNMIKDSSYAAFVRAAAHGHLPIMERLMALAPAEVLNMIKASNYGAFRLAADGGHSLVMERLIELAPDDIQEMIKAISYHAFCAAAENGNLPLMERLMVLAPNEVQDMISAVNFWPFVGSARKFNISIANRLLSFSFQMAHAEAHDAEFGFITHPFIANQLTLLRNRRLTLETADPHAVFDITDINEAKSCFYMARNFIRRNDPALLNDLRFLLEIPAVRALAHAAGTTWQANELLRLALSMNNEGAAQILLTIPAVMSLAERAHFYRNEARGAMDLGALARDRESSMHALSTGEQERLAAATALYQPIMQGAGVELLFGNILEELVERFEKDPAKIMIDGVEKLLPADWDSFVHMDLTDVQRKEALKAYYQNKDHCALRYLSRPNCWMAPNASYVYINDALTERWAMFEDYKPLIVLLWLAAQDKTVAPTDGITLEGRVEHFVDELALLGRAHNWDHKRVKRDGAGHLVLDAEGYFIKEEYDDLEGDKPSCFSGVKRRLFQSVIGHPLLKMLTEEDVQQELRDFVRAHFSRVITAENRAKLHDALMSFYGSAELADAAPLRVLDISAEQQAQFIQHLTDKYGRQFSGPGVKFKSTIEKAFLLVAQETIPSDCMHALKFAALANLDHLLQAPTVVAGAGASASAIGFFAGAGGAGAEPAATPAASLLGS